MLKRTNIVYVYDGSFYGMLCCVFESFEKKEMPVEIKKDGIFTLFPVREIFTDDNKAERVIKGIIKKIGQEALENIKLAYLTEFINKEITVLRYLQAGFQYGAKIFQMLADDEIITLLNQVKLILRERCKFIEFIRFSEFNGTLVAVIEPEHNVLPLIAKHFMERMPSEQFMIYDRSHNSALLYIDKKISFVSVDDFEMPDVDEEEKKYRRLWRMFYDTIEVNERHNERCRMNFMPKKYWKNMTEFMKD